jgi:hypothetical protein
MATKSTKPAAPAKSAPAAKEVKVDSGEFAFGKINFQLLLVSIALLLIGYFLMAGGKAENPAEFNPEVFSARRITIAPLVVLLGYCVGVYAIVKKAD